MTRLTVYGVQDDVLVTFIVIAGWFNVDLVIQGFFNINAYTISVSLFYPKYLWMESEIPSTVRAKINSTLCSVCA